VAGGLVLTLKGILAPLTITVGKMTVSTSSIGATIAALGAGCVFLTSREILRTTRRERSSR
jgi:hypothetical protein